MAAKTGFGSKFEIMQGSPAAYADIGEVFNITPAEQVMGIIEVTHYESVNRTREKLPTLIDGGEWTAEFHWDPVVTASDYIDALFKGATLCEVQVTEPDGVRIQFDAYITAISRTIPLEDKMTRMIKFTVTGQETNLVAA